MQRLYLDGEWNGHGGSLISLALAAEDGKHWYGIWPLPAKPHLWVAEHVIPYLNAMPATIAADPEDVSSRAYWHQLLRQSLFEYLDARPGATIYADWPADFEHLMRVMTGPTYETAMPVELSMQLILKTDPKPAIPHNALSDATALMEWHKLHG